MSLPLSLCAIAVVCAAIGAAAPVQADPIEVQFFGNTTLAVSDGKTVVMTDGFLSRPGLGKYVFGTRIASNPGRIEDALTAANLTAVAAIFVAHAHFDHALDIGYMWQRFEARIFGSAATTRIAIAQGVGRDDAIAVQDRRVERIGAFTVTALAIPHSQPNRYPGTVRPGFRHPAPMRAYRATENFAFLFQHGPRAALVMPSANVVAGKLQIYRADTVFLGIGGLNSIDREAAKRGAPGFIERYWAETVTAVGARTVIPIHWDNFFRKIEPGKPFKPPPRIIEDFDAVRARLNALAEAEGVCLHWMEMPFETVALTNATPCESGG